MTQYLAPGLRVVRRGTDQLQVGMHPGRRTVLPRTPATARALEALLEGEPVADDDLAARDVVQHLRTRGLLAGRERPGGTVALQAHRLLEGPLLDLLAASGVRTTRDALAADVTLLATVGETPREDTDPLVRHEVPHLLLRLVDGCALLGPFVHPGETACLRCTDAHVAVDDPHHVAVTARYVEASGRPRDDEVPDLADPSLVAVATGWAVRDLIAYLAGDEPDTWSSTLLLGPAPTRQVRTSWLRHPDCGCSWPADVGSSGRMEA